MSKDNLIKEGKDSSTIFVTGNTAIDALETTVRDDYSNEHLDWAEDSRLIIITAHRRENLGAPIKICLKLLKELWMSIQISFQDHI